MDNSMEDICSVVSMNFEGGLVGSEIQKCGQKVINNILLENNVTMFFGQKTSFKVQVPANYQYIGGKKTFMFYDKIQLLSLGDKRYKEYIKKLENERKLQRFNLPDSSFTIAKMRTRSEEPFQFIAVSWVTDHHLGRQACTMFRNLCYFLNSLSTLEGIPVLLSGTFHIDYDKALGLLPSSFRCQNYKLSSKRMSMRFSNLFITTLPLQIHNVVPVNAGKINLEHVKDRQKKVSAEDAFHYDPIYCTVYKDNNAKLPNNLTKLVSKNDKSKGCNSAKTSQLNLYNNQLEVENNEILLNERNLTFSKVNSNTEINQHCNNVLVSNTDYESEKDIVYETKKCNFSTYDNVSKPNDMMLCRICQPRFCSSAEEETMKTVSLLDLTKLDLDKFTYNNLSSKTSLQYLENTRTRFHHPCVCKQKDFVHFKKKRSYSLSALDDKNKFSTIVNLNHSHKNKLCLASCNATEYCTSEENIFYKSSCNTKSSKILFPRKSDFDVPAFLNLHAPNQKKNNMTIQNNKNESSREILDKSKATPNSKIEKISNMMISICGFAPSN